MMVGVNIDEFFKKKSMSYMVKVMHKTQSSKFTVNYDHPTIGDVIRIDHIYNGFNRIHNHLDPERGFEYASKVSLLNKLGSVTIYQLPAIIYYSHLPEYCNRNNVQNYSEFNDPTDAETYTAEEIYRTLRSVGLSPARLFGTLIAQLKKARVKLPASDMISYLVQSLKIEVAPVNIFSWVNALSDGLIRDPVMFSLSVPGQNNDKVYPLSSILKLMSYPVLHQFVMLLYYHEYRQWWDSGTMVEAYGRKIYISNHTVFETLQDMYQALTDMDLTIHPSVYTKELSKTIAERLLNENDNVFYPEDFQSLIKPMDGVRQLTCSVELTGEGVFMKHCIGGPRYKHALQYGGMIYFHIDLPGDEYGGTLSFKRAGLNEGMLRVKGTTNDEYWKVDQYYGYRDRSLIGENAAIKLRDEFIEQHFETITAEEVEEIKASPVRMKNVEKGLFIDYNGMHTWQTELMYGLAGDILEMDQPAFPGTTGMTPRLRLNLPTIERVQRSQTDHPRTALERLAEMPWRELELSGLPEFPARIATIDQTREGSCPTARQRSRAIELITEKLPDQTVLLRCLDEMTWEAMEPIYDALRTCESLDLDEIEYVQTSVEYVNPIGRTMKFAANTPRPKVPDIPTWSGDWVRNLFRRPNKFG